MKTILATLALAIVSTSFAQTASPPQFSWEGGFVFDTKLHTVDAIVLNNVYPLTVHGKKIGVSAALFAGTTVDKSGHSIGGGLVLWEHQLVDQVSISLGAGGGYLGGSGFRAVIEFGATIRL